MNGTWDGSKYVGNFLRLNYSGVDTEIDQGVLTFLNIFVICCLVVAAVASAISRELLLHQGGGWQLRQLI